VLTHQLGQTHDALASNIALYRATLAAAHGDGARGHVALMLHTMISTDRAQVRETVRAPFSAYLASSIDLIARDTKATARSGDYDLSQLPSRDKQFMVDLAFDRYFGTAGLFGTVEDGMEVVRRLTAVGVDEIACLIDFGVAPEEVLRSLRHLGELRLRTARPRSQ
jgi:natural product biosynthesis luciferase-like monooxygenase protein